MLGCENGQRKHFEKNKQVIARALGMKVAAVLKEKVGEHERESNKCMAKSESSSKESSRIDRTDKKVEMSLKRLTKYSQPCRISTESRFRLASAFAIVRDNKFESELRLNSDGGGSDRVWRHTVVKNELEQVAIVRRLA